MPRRPKASSQTVRASHIRDRPRTRSKAFYEFSARIVRLTLKDGRTQLLITNPGVVGYDAELRDNDIPFLAIPTTSGTGSEATRYSIFYVNEDEKHSVSHPGFLPGYVLLGLPPPYPRSGDWGAPCPILSGGSALSSLGKSNC